MEQGHILEKLKEKGQEPFVIDERVTLSDFKEFLKSLNDDIFESSEFINTSTLFPDEYFPTIFKEEIGIDYLKAQWSPFSMFMAISWQDANVSLIKDALELEECALSISIVGKSLSAVLTGIFKIADYELELQVELPSFLSKAKLKLTDLLPESDKRNALDILKNYGVSINRSSPQGQLPKLKHLLLLASPLDKRFMLNLSIANIQFGKVKDMKLEAELAYLGGHVSGFLHTEFEIEINKEENKKILIVLSAAYHGAGTGWQLEGGIALSDISLKDLFEALINKFELNGNHPPLPAALDTTKAQIKYVYLAFNTQSKEFTFSCSLDFKDFMDGEKGKGGEIELNLDFNFSPYIEENEKTKKPEEKHRLTFGGQLIFSLGEETDEKELEETEEKEPLKLEFDLVFSKDPEEKTLIGAYRNLGGGKINMSDLLRLLVGPDVGDLLNFEIDLKQAYIIWNKDDKEKTSSFLVGLDIGGGINLSGLPLLGDIMPEAQSLRIGLQPLYASAKFDKDKITHFQELVPGDSLSLPEEIKDKGVNITITLEMGGNPLKLDLPIKSKDVDTKKPGDTTNENGSTDSAPDTAADDGIRWINLQKSFGPVHFDRLGIKYQEKRFWFHLDGSLSLAGLTLSLDGLAVGVTLPKLDPQFDLRGLGLDYKKGGVEIGGAFLRIPGDPYDEFAGMALIKFNTFNLSAIGSYTWVEGHPSLFVYAVLNYPLGGPSFFFVTGLAAGFGYNRAINMPALQEVKKFPLVATAMNPDGAEKKDLKKILAGLHDAIPPRNGEYFLAVGVKFTSFEIIESFILLAVSFGVHFEVDVLGVSKLVVPKPDPKASAKIPPLVKAELQIKGAFKPDEGFLGIQAELNEKESHILSPDCHLMGGFAFYSWFSGEHEGDFVLTLGGYHPKFKVPDHYPKVPRLGYNWQVTPDLSIKGQMYYALTANALMAGASLHVDYDDGFAKAWFYADADFIISWKPYFYDASFKVEIGAKALGIAVSVRAGVHIWGPEFSGEAEIDLFLVSIYISFGSKTTVDPYISWEEFNTSFIPEKNKVVSINVTNGLIKEGEEEKETYFIVNAKDFELVVDSKVPITQAEINDATYTSGDEINIGDQKVKMADIGLKPVKEGKQVSSTMTLKFEDQKHQELFKFEPILKKVPEAIWGKPAPEIQLFRPKPDLNGARFVENSLAGFRLTPNNPPKPGNTHSIEKSLFQYSTHEVADAFEFEEHNDFLSNEVMIGKHIMEKKTIDNRDKVLKSLGFNLDTFGYSIDDSLMDSFVEMPLAGTIN